jgi:hypothetical protein
MHMVAFDTLKFVEKLQSGGFSADQAKAAAQAFAEATGEQLVSQSSLKDELSPIKAELLVIKWMIGFMLAFQGAIFAKLILH